MTEQKQKQEQITIEDAFKIQSQKLRKAIGIIKEDKDVITELVDIVNSKSSSKVTIDKSKITDGTDEQLDKHSAYISKVRAQIKNIKH